MATNAIEQLNGFDPLAEGAVPNSDDRSIFEEATRRVVQNILKSYTGYFDLFSEIVQNSLDAIERKIRTSKDFKPKIWIKIDIASRTVRIVDNGCGMNLEEIRFCFRPNVSFKTRKEARGHKGVGATFLAYGFGVIRLSTKIDDFTAAVRLAGGRQWADDYSGVFPRPKLEVDEFDISELKKESSGTAIEVLVDEGQRPDLGWWRATSADQWYEILRMRTPLGGIYLAGARPPKVAVEIQVTDYSNTVTTKLSDDIEYPYPHELTSVLPKVQSYEDVRKALGSLEGDSSKIPQEFKQVDALYGIWSAEAILEEGSPFTGQHFTDEQQDLIRKHNVSVYGCFLSTAKSWKAYQVDHLKIRRDPLVMKGGLLIASDFMVQGDLMVIPLTSTIGYQAATHAIVHFQDGNPDMGRKVFQPELKSLAEDLARQVVNIFKKYLYLMREDTGTANVADDTDTYHWLEEAKKFRAEHPLEFEYNGKRLAYASVPCTEQDVIAVFHELAGMQFFKGIRFFCTSSRERYDGCYVTHYQSNALAFDAENQPFGVSTKLVANRESRPYVLEYKFNLDGLISDFAKEEKFQNEIKAIVCWEIGDTHEENFSVRSYLIPDEGSGRQLFGATHSLWHERMKLADIVCLSDIFRYSKDAEGVVAEHKRRFSA